MPSENTETRKLTAIMFTDMVGYSALAQGDQAFVWTAMRAIQLLPIHVI